MLTSDSEKFMARIIKKDCGIPFKFHNLRHTYATILAENGAHPKYVQAQLGHSKFEFTLRYYTHVTDKMGQQAMAVLESEVRVPFTITDPDGERRGKMREGILVPSMNGNTVNVRFGSEEYYGELSDGENMDVWLDDHWIRTKLESNRSGWTLVGIKTDLIFGLKVRI